MCIHVERQFRFEGVIGNTPQMCDLIERLKRIAPTNASVLIQGETGTGKELVARAIHQNSPRKNKPFVALNCAALSENILESELFGHVKGAFTDASTDRVGKFEYAGGGTMFLDEVGDMPMATQIKLLRVLENGEITRVGSNDPIKVNVRILSASNRNLEGSIEAGTFRSDLYHRLKVVTIRLPTLVERSQDIPILIDYFVKQFATRHDKQIKGMSPAARGKMLAYDWPGNVRELRNVVESMVVFDSDGLLDDDDLPEEIANGENVASAAPNRTPEVLSRIKAVQYLNEWLEIQIPAQSERSIVEAVVGALMTATRSNGKTNAHTLRHLDDFGKRIVGLVVDALRDKCKLSLAEIIQIGNSLECRNTDWVSKQCLRNWQKLKDPKLSQQPVGHP